MSNQYHQQLPQVATATGVGRYLYVTEMDIRTMQHWRCVHKLVLTAFERCNSRLYIGVYLWALSGMFLLSQAVIQIFCYCMEMRFVPLEKCTTVI